MQTEPTTVIRRSSGPRGEVVLRRRGEADVVELIVNGAFAMDSSDPSSERQLARLALAHSATGASMLIGGLGLGYTAAEALDLPLGRLDVVELEGSLVGWALEGVTPVLRRVAADSRVALLVADVAEVLTGPAAGSGPWDAIALDVDNGPDFLIHSDNASLYGPRLLAAAHAKLAPGGRLAIWCQGPAPALRARLLSIAPSVQEHLFDVARGSRQLTYAIYTLDRPPTLPVAEERE